MQVHIIATGNYNFFNLLTICLCISLLDDHFFYRKKSRSENSKILGVLSTAACIAVYAGILYGTYVYYNLKFTENWNITSKIGFTQEDFDYALSRAVPYSIYIGMASLGLTVANAVTNSIINVKGTQKKLVTTLVTLLYTGIVASLFALSTVSIKYKLFEDLLKKKINIDIWVGSICSLFVSKTEFNFTSSIKTTSC